jgi:hypothetical protein
MSAPAPNGYDLTGFIDLHVHSAPDVQARYADDIEIAHQARRAGMRAVLIKSHVTLTADRAAIAEKVVGGLRVFGGLALNHTVGGLNPAAVEAALKMGAKEIWMPTRSAAHVTKPGQQPAGISIFDESGDLHRGVYAIIELVRQADVILATGHISPAETVSLARAGRQLGLKKLVVTHPEAAFIRMPEETQVMISGEGVYFERCFVDATPLMGSTVSIATIARTIRAVGVSSTVLSTDFGQVGNKPPVDGLSEYLCALAAQGFTPGEIQTMASTIPAGLLGI